MTRRVLFLDLRVFVVLAIVITAACQQSPAAAPVMAQPKAPQQKDRSVLPKKTTPQAVDCAGKGYTASFSAATQFAPPQLDVTFRGAQPTSASAEQAIRKCYSVLAKTVFVDEDIQAFAWWSATVIDVPLES